MFIPQRPKVETKPGVLDRTPDAEQELGDLIMVMRALRTSTKPIIWFVVLAFGGTIFLAWGMDLTRRPSEKGVIGEVAGRDIRDEEYRRVLDLMYYQKNQQNPGQELTEAEVRQIRDEAFNSIVQDILFTSEEKRLDLGLPDVEVVEYLRRFPPNELQSAPIFQTDGAFDYNKYQQAMLDPQYGQMWAQVENRVRPQLQQIKLQEYVVSLARATDPEIKMYFESAGEKRKIRYYEEPIRNFSQRIGRIDTSVVEAYYQEHIDDYYQDEMVELDYVKFMKEPSAEDSAIVINEMTDIRRQLDDGADFNELAKTYSNEPNALQSGGDLGWFGRNRMVAPFDSAVFALEVGEISAPVATQFGYHLIKLHEKRRVNDSDQVHASHILLKVETSGRTMSDLNLKAQNFLESVQAATLDSLATEYGLQVQNTGKFSRGMSIRGIGRDRNVEEFAFGGKLGSISNVFDFDDFYAVFKVKARYPAGNQPLDVVWGRVVQAAKFAMATDSARIEIGKVENEMRAGKTLTDAAKTYNREVAETDFFGRFESQVGLPRDPAFAGVAFSLSKERPTSPAFKAGTSFYILELVDEQEPDLEKYSAQRDSLYGVVLNNKRNSVYQKWYDKLYQRANVEDYRYQIMGGF